MDLLMLFQAFWVLGILSSLYKYNLWYKFCEHTFIALSIFIGATMASRTILNNAILPLQGGDLFLIIPIILGVLYNTRFSKKYGYLARVSIATMVGATMGAAIRVTVQSNIIGQIKPILTTPLIASGDILTTIGNFYAWIGLIAGLTYFVFATRGIPDAARKPYEILIKLGRYVILAMIGAQFANTTMGRQSVFIERIYFLLQAFGLAK